MNGDGPENVRSLVKRCPMCGAPTRRGRYDDVALDAALGEVRAQVADLEARATEFRIWMAQQEAELSERRAQIQDVYARLEAKGLL